MKFKAHDQFITAIAIQPETDKMVSGDIDGTIRVWRTIGDTQNEVIRKPDRRTLGVTALAFNPGSSILACGITYSLTNGKVEIRDSITWAVLTEVVCEQVFDLSWSPDGNFLAIATNHTIVVNTTTYQENSSLAGLESRTSCVAFSRSGQYLLAGGDFYDPSIALWKTGNFELMAQIPDDDTKMDSHHHLSEPSRFLYIDDEKTIIHGTVGVYEYNFVENSMRFLLGLGISTYVRKVAVSPGLSFVALEENSGQKAIPNWLENRSSDTMWARPFQMTDVIVVVKDLLTKEVVQKFEGFTDSITAIIFIGENRVIVGDIDGFLSVLDF